MFWWDKQKDTINIPPVVTRLIVRWNFTKSIHYTWPSSNCFKKSCFFRYTFRRNNFFKNLLSTRFSWLTEKFKIASFFRLFFQISVCHLEGFPFYLNNLLCRQSQQNYPYQIFWITIFLFLRKFCEARNSERCCGTLLV